MLSLREVDLEELIRHAKEEYPNEACGILAGKNGLVTKVYRMANIEKSTVTYLVDPEEQFQVFEEMEKLGLEMLGIYHSHSSTTAYPSERDQAMAFYPEAVYVIISLLQMEAPVVKAFRIEEGEIKEEDLNILPSR